MTEPVQPTAPVVIVGAGPTGLTAAALLARYGVASVVLERRTEPYPLPRAVHLDDEAMRILQGVGITEQFLPLTRPALGLRLLDADLRTMAEFSRSRAVGTHGHPQANMFHQPDLERILREHVASLPEVTLRTGAEVTGLAQRAGSVAVTLHTGELLEARFVLGCDGAGSTVRRLLDIPFEDLGFSERWLVVDARSTVPLGTWDGVHQICDPRRAATYMQVGADRYRWEFRLLDGEGPEDPDLDVLLRPWASRPLDVVRRVDYTFTARMAQRWRQDDVFLLGDAAHQTPPFIGQGLGSGLRDAQNLCWRLADVVQGRSNATVLDGYESERRPHARALIRKAVLVGWALTGGQDAAARVRRLALAVLCRSTTIRTAVLDRDSPRLRHVGRGRLCGTTVPQPMVRYGGHAVLLDQVLGDGFTVLSDGPVPPVLAGFPALRLGVDLDSPDLVAWLRRSRVRAVLVRPDRVVARETRRPRRSTS